MHICINQLTLPLHTHKLIRTHQLVPRAPAQGAAPSPCLASLPGSAPTPKAEALRATESYRLVGSSLPVSWRRSRGQVASQL